MEPAGKSGEGVEKERGEDDDAGLVVTKTRLRNAWTASWVRGFWYR